MGTVDEKEYEYLVEKLGRKPNELEQDIIGVEWSEHCSYKSSKIHIRSLPTKGNNVVIGPGYDAGVVDVGDGYVVTVHIESHNHPSAVEPFGGAATGVGGVLRDIISMGSRPIALYNALRFGNIDETSKFRSKNRWLFKNVVKGIADYGNCMGIPTLGGEIEFDESFNNYCLVDVASIGLAKKSQLVRNKAEPGDWLILGGNTTGVDGIHGASFASKELDEENRSAVQIPDPFLEKTLLEATMEALENNCISSMKDLGGGGLSCCLSETADNLNKGFQVELGKIPLRQSDMTDSEIMISESQERMLYIVSEKNKSKFCEIFDKHNVRYAFIGQVIEGGELSITKGGKIVAHLPAKLVAHAPLLDRPSREPSYLVKIREAFNEPPINEKIDDLVLKMMSNPSVCSRKWVYQQFDHEVGLRTVAKPGQADSSLVKLSKDKYLSFTLDGNSKQCYLDPYQGVLGCLSEALRNITCVGADPLGVVDHLQFGNPENEEIFWSFLQTIKGIRDFCNVMNIPVVGGKVSLYNETSAGPIKPSPVIGMLGIVDSRQKIRYQNYRSGESIFIIGVTRDELGGSEYFEYCLNLVGGNVPQTNLRVLKETIRAIHSLREENLIESIHDCSKGGLIVTLLEMAIHSNLGFIIQADKIPSSCSRIDYLIFSETHDRFIFTTRDSERVKSILENFDVTYSEIGSTKVEKSCIIMNSNDDVLNIGLEQVSKNYETSLDNVFEHVS
ncbi:phosphoribosylformylglycinamidine synthase subunit PurL [Candidatus Nitrosocosmicus franklandus]|uniref:phosphoribosylformylglycinamidine synthase subunit PurL n=1 Tax=Candidatus Nitrosocosmicus franklandianus TaxID=1798806 RepID=UPI00106CF879|nr:phosphoribosylformylglycinamidine synthase subunit PurL [Candidatus Nitrosocosmicus franklandus]